MKNFALMFFGFLLIHSVICATGIEKAQLNKERFKIGERFTLHYNLSTNYSNETKEFRVKVKLRLGGEKDLNEQDYSLIPSGGISGESYSDYIQVIDNGYGEPGNGAIIVQLYEFNITYHGTTKYIDKRNPILIQTISLPFEIIGSSTTNSSSQNSYNHNITTPSGLIIRDPTACNDGNCKICFFPGIIGTYEVCYNVKNWNVMEKTTQGYERTHSRFVRSLKSGYIYGFSLYGRDHDIDPQGFISAWVSVSQYSSNFTAVGYISE